MFGNSFYHGTIRKSVTLFGNIFNDISIQRFDKTGKSLQTIRVPIIYGARDKYVSLLSKETESGRTQIELPMMSFVMTNIAPASGRKMSPINKNIINAENGLVRTSFVEMPYDIDFELSIYTKSADDASQIVEQILPYFTPDFNANLKFIPELGLDKDIKTVLSSMSMSNDIEGDPNTTRVISWVLSFTMETFIIGPISKEGLIRKVTVDIHTSKGPEVKNDSGTSIQITPGLTADGNPTSVKTESINRNEINPDDPYGFISEFIPF